jgi:hypothetical protein
VDTSGPLHQAHGTVFKSAIQHALNQGADTVYYPTSNIIGAVRKADPSDYASIYDQQIMKEGLKPLLKIPGITARKVGDSYHEIDFTPEAKEFILKGEGQLAPGYAEGGLVSHAEYSPLDVDYIIGNVMSGQHETPEPEHGYAEGGSVDVPDLEFEDPESARLYKHAMKMGAGSNEVNTFGTGISKNGFNLGVDVARMNPQTNDRLMNSLMANYGVKLGDVGINASVRKPLDAEGVYLGMLNGSIPVGKGMAMLGVQGIKTSEGHDVTGYSAGWSGEAGPGRLNVNVMQPKGHPSNRAAQVQYQVPFAKGGSVESAHAPYDEAKISSLVNALREELNA